MTKFLFATMLALGMSSVAFAGEGGHDAFAQSTPGVVIANPPASFDVGSAAYPELPRAYAFAPTGEDVIEAQGREGIVQTANSLPRGRARGHRAICSAAVDQPLLRPAGGTQHVRCRPSRHAFELR